MNASLRPVIFVWVWRSTKTRASVSPPPQEQSPSASLRRFTLRYWERSLTLSAPMSWESVARMTFVVPWALTLARASSSAPRASASAVAFAKPRSLSTTLVISICGAVRTAVPVACVIVVPLIRTPLSPTSFESESEPTPSASA